MKRPNLTLVALGLAAALAACGKKEAAAPAPAEPTAAGGDAAATNSMASSAVATNSAAPASGNMSTMQMSGPAMTGTGEGEVKAVDKTAGTITLKHGPIPGVKWPAMTMTFKANPAALVDQVKVGDKVSFDVKVQGQDNEVTAIRKP
ncbi:copper-binding protein [Phenylobacterium soli]|uniref:Copper-binding protein n=1 Tax=Phenylobacterium soli TaxID=2170551 RepID=A0A328AJH2_9CAUL|nr:copper-binding protein [Phenylobacterium soli]RAK54940.1 copper-binding protein [Phenylobacterium soli]